LLIRSAIAATSPALLAENQDWANILYALGGQPKKAKFVARSAGITELITRARAYASQPA
jgi:hypothetical protein